MACACPSQGSTVVYLTKAGAGTQVFTSGAKRMLIERFGLKADEELIVHEASTGNRDQHTNRATDGLKRCSGPIAWRPSFNDFKTTGGGWGVRILGGDNGGDIFSSAATLPSFAMFAATTAKQLQFEDLKVASIEFTAETGQSLLATAELVGKNNPDVSITVPSIALGLDEADLPLIFHRAFMVVDGIDYCFSKMRIRIDNGLRGLFYNSKTAKCLNEGPLNVSVSLDLPWNADTATALYGHGQDGLACGIHFEMPTQAQQLHFDLASLKWPNRTPEIGDQNEIVFPLEARSFATNTNPSIKITAYDP
jgi:hypothetical protein